MIRRAAAALAIAVAMLSCEGVLGIGDLTVAPGAEQDASGTSEASSGELDGGGEKSDAPLPVEDADAAKPGKRVFVTSTMSNGIIGGRDGADSICTVAASNAKLSGKWIAWLSQGGTQVPDAPDRIPHDGPFRRLDNIPVAHNKAQLLSGSLLAPIITTETGTLLTSPPIEESRVWTGTTVNGKLHVDCIGWSTGNSLEFGSMGTLTRVDANWTRNGGPGFGFTDWGCQTLGRLYCFEL